MKTYKFISLSLAVIFFAVGLIFLFIPNGVLRFFNALSGFLGMPTSPVEGMNFYLVLAVGYMYLVTLLAIFMFCFPQDRRFPLLLVNGKLASSLLSFYLFLTHQPYLIYIANGVIDGFIGVFVLVISFRMRKAVP